MHRAGADAERLRRLEDTGTGRQLSADMLHDIGAYRATPQPRSLTSRPREASLDTLDNHGALELGKHPHHLEHRLSGWRAGVDTL
jgi:hypothetical protein